MYRTYKQNFPVSYPFDCIAVGRVGTVNHLECLWMHSVTVWKIVCHSETRSSIQDKGEKYTYFFFFFERFNVTRISLGSPMPGRSTVGRVTMFGSSGFSGSRSKCRLVFSSPVSSTSRLPLEVYDTWVPESTPESPECPANFYSISDWHRSILRPTETGLSPEPTKYRVGSRSYVHSLGRTRWRSVNTRPGYRIPPRFQWRRPGGSRARNVHFAAVVA